ncbi:Ig-like domain-containing protein, partial [Flavobacteriaceae bacterium]|nr:Ig-like domain-containing protein [Flavobacteriaceae bacterium]
MIFKSIPKFILYSLMFWLFASGAIYGQFTGTNEVMNNGYLRFGNGTENSINSTGNLEQPWFYDLGWRKLTYSSRDLEHRIGVGGVGSDEWNLNGNNLNNPVMKSGTQVFDTSSFTVSGTLGYGTILVKGTVELGAYTFELTNAYTLGENDKFIQVQTTIKNIGSIAATNLRYWIGTSDDHVGGDDFPLKERGNIIDGSFELITLQTQRSRALRISSNDYAILFFTPSSRANNAVDRYSFVTIPAVDQDPEDSPITIDHDGSYAMFFRMNDLAVNESDSLLWYYTASPIDELDDVIKSFSTEVALTDNHTDDYLKSGDSVVVTATFNNAMTASPTVDISGTSVSGVAMTATASSAVWIYRFDSTLFPSDGTYYLSVKGTDTSGNAYTGTDSLTYTIDNTRPLLSNYQIQTSNATNTRVKVSDTVTLTFDVSEQASSTLAANSVEFGLYDNNGSLSPLTSADSISLIGTNTIQAVYQYTETNTAFDHHFIHWQINSIYDLAGNISSVVSKTAGDSDLFMLYDNVIPSLDFVSINSDYPTYTEKAKDGNTIFLEIIASEDIVLSTSRVTILGANASTVTLNASNTIGESILWDAQSRAVLSTDPSGTVTFSIDFVDLAGNVGTQVVTTTNPPSNSVEIDRAGPVFNPISIYSNNASTNYAKVGDIVSLQFTVNEMTIDFAATIAGNVMSLSNLTNLSTDTFRFDYTMRASDPEGPISFTLLGSDTLNNPSSLYTAVTTGTLVYFDKTPPTVALTDDHLDSYLVSGDVVLVRATFSEGMQVTPTVEIDGGVLSATAMTQVSSSVWTYSVDVDVLSPADGTYQLSVNGNDLAGNAYAGTDSLTYTIDTIIPTVTLTDDHPDAYLVSGDVVLVTATFSEGMQASPMVEIDGGVLSATAMTQVSSSVWTYSVDVDLLSPADGTYQLTVDGSDVAGNVCTCTNSITFNLDINAPTVVNVRTTNASGRYTDDDNNAANSDVIEILVNFDEAILIDTTAGTPTLELETGDIDYSATYTYTNSNTAYFDYTIDDGILTSPLNYSSTTALALNGAVLTDTGGNTGVISLPALGTTDDLTGVTLIEIDSENPTLISPQANSNNASSTDFGKDGDIITFRVSASEALDEASITVTATSLTGVISAFAETTSGSSIYEATYTILSTDPEGELLWEIAATDLASSALVATKNPSQVYRNSLSPPVPAYNISSSVNIDRTAPVISSASSISINENQTATLDITSNEPSYVNLSGGPDAALLSAGPTTSIISPFIAALTFNTAPDFESPQDANADNIYELIVSLIDQTGNVATQTISITILDVD